MMDQGTEKLRSDTGYATKGYPAVSIRMHVGIKSENKERSRKEEGEKSREMAIYNARPAQRYIITDRKFFIF
jgi:hypothetical protein